MSRRLPPLIDVLVTVVLLVALGLIVLRLIIAAGAHGEETYLRDDSARFRSANAVSIVNGSEELVWIGFDGSLRFGPHYTPEEAARIFWQSIAHAAPGAVRRACFARLRRERERMRKGAADGGGGGREPAAWVARDLRLRARAGDVACRQGIATCIRAQRDCETAARVAGDVAGRCAGQGHLPRGASDGVRAASAAPAAAGLAIR